LSGSPWRWHRGADLSLFFSGRRMTERSVSVVVVFFEERNDVLKFEVLMLAVAVLAVAASVRDIGVVKEVVTQNVVERDVWHLLLR
jgi:hypothetical protein